MKIAIVISLIIGIVFYAAIIGKDPAASAPEDYGLRTVQHDGHTFIIFRKSYHWQPVHHPGCPCRKASAELLPEAP